MSSDDGDGSTKTDAPGGARGAAETGFDFDGDEMSPNKPNWTIKIEYLCPGRSIIPHRHPLIVPRRRCTKQAGRLALVCRSVGRRRGEKYQLTHPPGAEEELRGKKDPNRTERLRSQIFSRPVPFWAGKEVGKQQQQHTPHRTKRKGS